MRAGFEISPAGFKILGSAAQAQVLEFIEAVGIQGAGCRRVRVYDTEQGLMAMLEVFTGEEAHEHGEEFPDLCTLRCRMATVESGPVRLPEALYDVIVAAALKDLSL